MVNHQGVNGYGKKNYPSDNVLEASLIKYSQRGLTQTEKLANLASDHQLNIGRSQLNQLERRFDIPSVRRSIVSKEAMTQAVIDEVEQDLNQSNGPNYIKSQLKNRNIQVPRDLVRQVMAEHFPGGAQIRYPGNRKAAKTHRSVLSSIGPYHEVAGDGHEKLGAAALDMGGLGLPIYGYREKWSGCVLDLQVIPDSRSNGAIGHVYLDLVEKLKGAPLQLNVDKGAEIGWEVAIQEIIREMCPVDDDLALNKAVELLKSIHNIIIESLWHWLREKKGDTLRNTILRGKHERLINTDIEFQRHLFYWIFVPLTQKELNEFKVSWNQRRVRSQPDKSMPSGHVPIDALEHPERYGGRNCMVTVSNEMLGKLRKILDDEVGPRENFLSFFPSEFATLANEVYDSIGQPTLTLQTSWDVFCKMSPHLEHIYSN